tara:strand:+ start:10911 stop:11474 length:564 start_codon:yes stop_codon:yes gene_type:complete
VGSRGKNRIELIREATIHNKSKGFVLVLVMLLMTILSLSAFIAVEQSQFSYKSNNGRITQIKARQISEDARLDAIKKLDTLLKDNELKMENLTSTEPLDRLKTQGFKQLFNISHTNSKAEVYLKELPTQLLRSGVPLSQNIAYSGLGLGLGSHGSFSARYELLAKGIANDKGREVTFWTASDYRFTP